MRPHGMTFLVQRKSGLPRTYFSSRTKLRITKLARSGPVRVLATSNVEEVNSANGSAKVVFVAGATGRTGIRVVRDLADRGYQVRAGVRDVARAQRFFDGKDVPAGVGYTGAKDTPLPPINRDLVQAVACDVEDVASLKTALGDATLLVSCIGAPESQPLDPTLPRRVDGQGGKNLVLAAKDVGVRHFVMVSSLGTGKFGWPASALNLFWNVLDWKREAELELVKSGIPFTIVRPGGMERPTDDYKQTHNTNIYPQDTQFGGQISRLQVAEICADALCHPAASANKILEVVAEEEAPIVSPAQLMEKIDAMEEGGPAPEIGSPAYYNNKYIYKGPSKTAKWFDIMGFAGLAPEAVNARLAMIGVIGLLVSELQGKGNVATQVQNNGMVTVAIMTLIAAISLVPFAKGVETKDAQAGPFTSAAELTNGRLAMLAIAVVLYVEHTSSGSVFIDVVKHALPF